MTLRSLSPVALCALICSMSSSAFADDDIQRPEAGDLSLAFGVPSGGNSYAAGAAGVWYMLSENLNLGLNLGAGVRFNEPEAWDLLISPAGRFYFMTEGRIAPFGLGQANLRIFENTAGDVDVNFSLLGGVGAEVWLITELSLSGYIGLGFDIYQGQGSNAALGTLTSGLTLNFYFGGKG